MSKRIGILTSGGDCAGLNAIIRGVVRRAVAGHGWRVIGIRQGTLGLLGRPIECEDLVCALVPTAITADVGAVGASSSAKARKVPAATPGPSS